MACPGFTAVSCYGCVGECFCYCDQLFKKFVKLFQELTISRINYFKNELFQELRINYVFQTIYKNM
jgi:hypothetical protein